MDSNAEKETDVLMRIVALLFALADLADRAAGRSLPVRARVLAILRPAESVAWGIVVREARQCGAPIPVLGVSMPADGNPDDAPCLAARLRSLGLALAHLAAACSGRQEQHRVTLADTSASALHDMPAALSAIAGPALPRSCFDTS